MHFGWYYLPFTCLFFTQKNGAFGLPKLKLTAACAHAEMETETERERDGRQSRNKNPVSSDEKHRNAVRPLR